jgi:FkbM family methyltransferase
MLRDSVIDALRPYRFRGKLRLLDGIVPRRGSRTARVFGFRMELDLAEAIQRWIYMGAFEPVESAMVAGWLRPGMTFLDVGANFGYFTMLAASRVGPEGRVLAVEPSPYAHERLARSLEANRIRQARAFRMGLSSRAGELNLYVPAADRGFHSPTMSAGSGGEPVVVPVRRLDDCLEEWGVERVDLMKIDIEGHEPQALEGGYGALSSGRIRAVLCEFNDHWLREQGGSPAALYEMLLEAGFRDTAGPARFEPGCCDNRFFVHRAASDHAPA